MMELVRGAGDTLLNADTQNEDVGDVVSEKEGAVYFDREFMTISTELATDYSSLLQYLQAT